ncbi:hypothetical protein Hanom_Chr08g00692371 [Helianthus anomalus]
MLETRRIKKSQMTQSGSWNDRQSQQLLGPMLLSGIISAAEVDASPLTLGNLVEKARLKALGNTHRSDLTPTAPRSKLSSRL